MRFIFLILLFATCIRAETLVYRPIAIKPLAAAGGGGGGISFVNANGANIATTASPTISYPASPTLNDIWLCIITTETGHNTTGTPPTGWNKLDETDEPGTDSSTTVFWKRATGSEGGSEVWTSIFDASEIGRSVVLAYRGCKTSGSPINTSITETSTAGTAKDVSEVTTTVNNCMLVAIMGSDPAAAMLMTWDMGITERIGRDTTPSGNNGTATWISVGEKLLATAGASGTMGGDLDASDTAVEFIYALEPL